MTRNRHTYFAIGAFMMASAVMLGAFGAHGLVNKVSPKYVETWKTATEYLMYNALAIMAFSSYRSGHKFSNSEEQHREQPKIFLQVSMLAVFLGVILFCVSLYAVSLHEIVNSKLHEFKHIAPFGGTLIALGWIGVGAYFLSHKHPK